MHIIVRLKPTSAALASNLVWWNFGFDHVGGVLLDLRRLFEAWAYWAIAKRYIENASDDSSTNSHESQ